VCIASPKTAKAIRDGKIAFGKDARAVFIGSNIESGQIEGKGLIVNSQADNLIMKGDGIVWSIRAPPVVTVEDGTIVTDVYHEGAIQRVEWPIATNPTKGTNNPYDKFSASIQAAGPIEIEKVIGVLKTSSAGQTLSERDSDNISLAAKVADLSDAKGTIAYDDTRLSPNQQQALQSLIGVGTQGLVELESKLGCKVRLLSQGSIEDNPNTIIISGQQSANYAKAKYFIIDQTQVDLQDKAVYIAVFSHIPIAKGLLGLTDKTQQSRLYAALKQSIRSLSQGLLNEREIEDAIDAYLSGNPMFIKLPPAVSYEGRFEDLQRAALMTLIAA